MHQPRPGRICAAIFALSFLFAGCLSEPGTPSVGNNDGPNATTNNANSNNSTCVPDTCPTDSCGALDDGCGGTIDCGACACDGGVATEPSCGPCGLGQTLCDTSDGVCELPGLPDIDTSSCDTEIVYAVPNGSNEASGDGTKESPFTTIDAALDAAEASGASIVVVGGGGTTVREVFLRDGISLIGGYDTDFNRDASVRSKIDVEWHEPALGDLMGVAGVEIENETHFSGFDISTDDNPANGDNNYAIYLRSASGLVIDGIAATAGAGGAGMAGLNGSDGANGGDGENGRPGREYVSFYDNNAPGGAGGAAGMGGGDGSCATPGGAGGRGGDMPDWTNGADGLPGDSPGGAGGTQTNPDGQSGTDATQPTRPGDPGEGGDGPGMVVDGFWANPDGIGSAGMPGEDGQGGGGGGGALHTPFNGNGDGDSGPGGGGGGGGGCAGGGGDGGQPGGGSFGLFVIDSEGIQISNSSFASGDGGLGGAGGQGGQPGAGGTGGSRGNTIQGIDQDNIYQSMFNGGTGGDGSSGTRGGDGGAGAGGVSYGAYCLDTTLDLNGADLTFESGQGGLAGGEGALVGEEADVVGCSGSI